MTHFIDAFLEPALWSAADWSLRWAALLVVVALILWIFRPRRAAIRQLVLLVALIAGLLVPFAPRWGDGWEQHQIQKPEAPFSQSIPPSFPSSAWERTSGSSASRATQQPDAKQSFATVRSQAELGNEENALSGGRQPPETREPLGRRRIIVLGLASCWSTVVAYQLIRSLCGWLFLRRLRRESSQATGATADLFTACCAELRVGNSVRLATHPHVRSPILLGWLRPRIIVPPDWLQRSHASQRAGLLHELAHVRRRDHLLAPFLEIVRIAFFYHPLVRWLLARLEHERELLCDEMVVRLGVDRRDYARLLLELARLSGRLAWPAASLPMSRRRTVKGRIHHLLEEDMERWIRPLPVRWAIVLGAGLLTLSLGLAGYRVWADEKDKAEKPTIKVEQQPAPNKPAEPSIKREDLRYGGKDFNQWRRELVTELKPSVRADGMKAFAAFGTNGYGPEATQAILEIMRGYDVTNYDKDDYAVIEASRGAMSKIGVAALPALTQAVEGENRNVRRFAIDVLGGFRTDARSAVPVLLKAIKDEDTLTRRSALQAVQRINSHAKGYVPVLIEALKDEDAEVRNIAASNLRVGASFVKKNKSEKSAVAALLGVLHDKDFNVRHNAIWALNDIGPVKQGVATVIPLLEDKYDDVQQAAYFYLRSLGPDAKEAVPAIIAVLKTQERNWRDAIDTLAAIGPAAKAAIPELIKLSQGPYHPDIQHSAIKALKIISADDQR